MRVVCESCGATYKIPEQKLNKDVNKATCRKCGARMAIRRQGNSVNASPIISRDESTLITTAPPEVLAPPAPAPAPAVNPWAEEGPTRITMNVQGDDFERPTAVEDAPPPRPAAPPVRPAPAPTPAWTPPAPAPAAPAYVAPAPAPPSPVYAAAPAPAAPVYAAPAPTPAYVAPPPTPAPPSYAAPAPAPAAPVYAAPAPAFDPTGDMTWVLVGAVFALLGALVLGLDLTGSSVQRGIGLSMALAGLLAGIFILFTGGRGRYPAAPAISVVLALVLGTCGGGGLEALRASLAPVAQPPAPAPPLAAVEPATPPSDLSPKAQDDIDKLIEEKIPEEPKQEEAVAAVAEPPKEEPPPPPKAEPPKAEPPRAEPVRPAPAPAPAPVRGSGTDVVASSSRSSSSSPSTSRTSSTSDYRAPAIPSDPVVNNNPSCSSGMSSIPTPVLETMISSNKSVKRCFYEEKQRAGSLPGRVDVRLTIRPTGNVESARVTTAEFKGSELDACLSGVLRSISMPCFTGETMKVTYPFVL